MRVNGLVNFVAVVVSWYEFVGSKPAGNVILAEISVEPLGDGLILMGVTNEEGMILNGSRGK
jgi:hypothetical protein